MKHLVERNVYANSRALMYEDDSVSVTDVRGPVPRGGRLSLGTRKHKDMKDRSHRGLHAIIHTSIYKEQTLMIFREVNVGFVVFNLMLDIVIPTSLAEGSVLQSVSMGLSSRPPVSGSPNLLSRTSHLDSFFLR